MSRRELSNRLDTFATQPPVWRSQQERELYYERVALVVIEKYVEVRSLSPLVASIIDPDHAGKSTKLTFNHLDYIADIEMATERALAHLPNLQAAWFALAKGDPIAADLRTDVLQRCGRIYAARRLEPWKYWRKSYARPQ